MKSSVVAYVPSSNDSMKIYAVVCQENNVWRCNCSSFFFGDQKTPCKHIERVRTLDRVQPGAMVQKQVQLTEQGVVFLKRWRDWNNMPLVRPEPSETK